MRFWPCLIMYVTFCHQDEEFDADADSEESEDSASEDDPESGKDGDDEVENEESDEPHESRRHVSDNSKGSPELAATSRTSSAPLETRQVSALEAPGPAKKPAPYVLQRFLFIACVFCSDPLQACFISWNSTIALCLAADRC